MAMSIRREDILGSDFVSRWLFSPPQVFDESGHLIWKHHFQFATRTTPSGNRTNCESLVWRRYAKTIFKVHNLGCLEGELRRREKGIDKTYIGCVTASVGVLRSLQSNNGHSFYVIHEPCDNGVIKRYHAHICYKLADGSEIKDLTKNDKIDLRDKLVETFSNFSCCNSNSWWRCVFTNTKFFLMRLLK
jgi:hypothetical protein